MDEKGCGLAISRGLAGMAAVILVVAVLAGCSSPAPSASVAPSAPGAIAVLPVCDDPPRLSRIDTEGNEVPLPVRLTCGEAVAAALAVLGNDHPPISAVGFHYGNCPPYARCLMLPNLDQGFVVFRFGRSGTVDLHVTVRVDNAGTVVADSPQPVPAYRSLSVLTQPGHQQ